MKQQIQHDAEEFARIIFADLNISADRTKVADLRSLCEQHCMSVFPTADLPRELGAYYIGKLDSPGACIVSMQMSAPEFMGAMIHELVHHLAFSSPRYEEYNGYFQQMNYDRIDFNERLARGVEKLWIQTGGSTFHIGRLYD